MLKDGLQIAIDTKATTIGRKLFDDFDIAVGMSTLRTHHRCPFQDLSCVESLQLSYQAYGALRAGVDRAIAIALDNRLYTETDVEA
jgi:hypothetical protein